MVMSADLKIIILAHCVQLSKVLNEKFNYNLQSLPKESHSNIFPPSVTSTKHLRHGRPFRTKFTQTM